MNKKDNAVALADRLFPEGNQQDFADGILSVPPEQRRLHTETYDFTVSTIAEKLTDGSVFIPEYQRRYVWSDAQASRLIESLIIQCPIPVIYLNQETDERLSVIDGNQRLTSIKRFLANEFPLKSLTAYPELEGNRAFELDPRIRRHVENRTLRCIVILKDTHPQVKFDVFERLNSGATKLNPQELRHGLYFGDAVTLAARVVKSSDLLSVLDIRADKRMKAEELVLRFWALLEGRSDYRKPLASFINSYTEANRVIPDDKKRFLERIFLQTLTEAKRLFGDLLFRVFGEDLDVASAFNAAIYDAEMVALAEHIRDQTLGDVSPKDVQLALGRMIEYDERFQKSISIATSDEAQVKYRINALADLLRA
jgi:hypothetical protein